MTSKTHAALGLFSGLIIKKYYPNFDTYDVISGAIIGSLLPDLDTQNSVMAKIFPLVSRVVDKLTKHRGFTHMTFPLLLIFLYYQYHYLPWLSLGIGSASHSLIDFATYALGITCDKEGNIGEKIIYYILCIINIAMITLMILESQGIKIDINIDLIQNFVKVRKS